MWVFRQNQPFASPLPPTQSQCHSGLPTFVDLKDKIVDVQNEKGIVDNFRHKFWPYLTHQGNVV